MHMEPGVNANETRRGTGFYIGTGLLALLVVIGVFIFQQLSSIAGGRIADALNSRAIDPDNVFMWLFIHHLAQTAFSLVVIAILSRALHIDFRIKPSIDAGGARMLLKFCAAMCVYAVLYYVIGYKLGMLIPFGYESSARNIVGMLSFQLLMSGPAEELLFRAIPITLLAWALRRCRRPLGGVLIVVASLLFAVAHINWYTDPFRLSFYWYQLSYAFVLGLLYGAAYLKRGSVLYPMIMHSMSNVIVFSFGYVFYALV